MLQQTPLDVTGEFPSLVIVPPQVAVVDVMSVAAVVLRIGITFGGSFLQLKVSAKSRHVMTTVKVESLVFIV